MIRKKVTLLIFFIYYCFCQQGLAQYTAHHTVNFTIPEIAIVDIEPANMPINLNFKLPTEAGKPMATSIENKELWVNYSCALSNNSTARNIYLQTTGVQLPTGIALDLSIGNAVGGQGQLGKSIGNIQLTNLPQLIITDIGRGYTGNGTNVGHQLIYKLVVTDYAKLTSFESGNIQVMVTISE